MTEKTNLRLLDTEAKKVTHTSVDTIMITPESAKAWKSPPFQRPLRVNDKVSALAEQIRADGGVLPGVLTLGVLSREVYLLDGQHRRESFLLSGCKEGYADVRKHFFEDFAEMGREFVNLNSQLVRLRPDDVLRGLEGVNAGIRYIREKCPFVGYDQIRRGTSSPILSMSSLLRCWYGSLTDIPSYSGTSAMARANVFSVESAEACAGFLSLAAKSWGRDPEYAKLWGALNLTICMWFYVHAVVNQFSPNTPKVAKEMFAKCLTSLSAESGYMDWLMGRNLGERDRSPCYGRIKAVFARRIEEETGKKARLPAPPWAHHLNRATYG